MQSSLFHPTSFSAIRNTFSRWKPCPASFQSGLSALTDTTTSTHIRIVIFQSNTQTDKSSSGEKVCLNFYVIDYLNTHLKWFFEATYNKTQLVRWPILSQILWRGSGTAVAWFSPHPYTTLCLESGNSSVLTLLIIPVVLPISANEWHALTVRSSSDDPHDRVNSFLFILFANILPQSECKPHHQFFLCHYLLISSQNPSYFQPQKCIKEPDRHTAHPVTDFVTTFCMIHGVPIHQCQWMTYTHWPKRLMFIQWWSVWSKSALSSSFIIFIRTSTTYSTSKRMQNPILFLRPIILPSILCLLLKLRQSIVPFNPEKWMKNLLIKWIR